MEPKRRRGLLTSHNLWLTAAIAIVLAIAVFSRLDTDAFREAVDGAQQSRTVVDEAQLLLTLLKDVETGQRGFLLTGDAGYLAPYNEAVPRVAPVLRRLEQSAGGSDVQRLAQLTRGKLEETAQTIQVRQQGDVPAALAIVRTNRGKQAMDEIRVLASRIIEEQNRRYHDLNARAQRHGYQTLALVQAGAILLALLLWIAIRRINKLIGSQEKLIVNLNDLRDSEERGRAALATTLRSIGDAVIAADVHGRVHFMNPVAEDLTGWTTADAGGRPLVEVFRVEDEATRRPAADLVSRVLREGTVVGLANHTILIARDGREIPVDDSAAPILDDADKITGVVLVFRDVTARRRAQRELEDSESRYRLLFESNPAPMWVYDTETLAFLAVNHAAVRRYGYTAEEFRSMTLRDIRPAEDVPALLADVSAPERELHTDGPRRHRKKDGTVFLVEITAHPLQFAGVSACLVMAIDVTDRARLEEQLRQSQKLEAVGQLAGGIAHDFNNLLTVIEGYAEMIRGDQQPGDPHREPVEEILVAAQRAASLTRQLLAFSRRQVLQPSRLSVNANVASTQRMLARLLGEQIQIRVKLAADLWDVWADPGQIDQIILNLAVNGRDAMERGGTLTIETCNVEFSAEEARKLDLAPGEYVRLSLTDTGHGMDEETQRHIFEPFFTTKEVGRGTGLGLSTVYGIVKQSGGHVTVNSTKGKGSTFSILLPRARGRAVAAAKTAAPAPQHGAGATILLLEDDQNVQQLVTAMLKSGGYEVIPTSTPDEALKICGDPGAGIDLLLTDMVLPEGDGGKVAEQAVVLRPGLRVLFMSGYTEHPVLHTATFNGKTPFLQKPFTKSALISKVRETMK